MIDIKEPGRYMLPAEVATAMGCTQASVYVWIKSGRMKALHAAPRCWLIPIDEIDRVADARKGWHKTGKRKVRENKQ